MTSAVDRKGSGSVAYDEGLRRHMLSVYAYLGYGLAVSAASAWLIHQAATTSTRFEGATAFGQGLWLTRIGEILYGWPGLVGVLVVGISLILAMGRTVGRGSFEGSMTLYLLFTAFFGLVLAISLGRVSPGVAVKAASMTALTFGAMSLYGYTTKRDLSGLGSFLAIGLLALIGAGLMNALAFKSGLFEVATSAVGVLVFVGWVAYDTQRIKESYDARLGRGSLGAIAVWGAMGLYLDVVNLLTDFVNLVGFGGEGGGSGFDFGGGDGGD